MATTSNPIDAALSTTGQNAIDAAMGVVKAGAGAAGGVMDILDRPHQALTAQITRGKGLETFVHGETPEQEGEDRATIRKRIGLEDRNSLLGRSGLYSEAPHWAQGIVDTAIDTVTDPTSLIGGAGLGRRAVAGVAEKAVPTLIRGFDKAHMMANPGSPLKAGLSKLGDLGGWFSDVTTPGGAESAQLARTLARTTGSNRTYQQLYSLRNVYDMTEKQLIERLGQKQGHEMALKWLGRQLKTNFPGIVQGGGKPTKDTIRFFTHAVKGAPDNPLIKGSNLSKGTLFWNPFQHMKNIGTLTALAGGPEALANTLKKAGIMAGADVVGNVAKRMGHQAWGDALRAKAETSQIGLAKLAGASHVQNLEQQGLIKALQSIPGVGKAVSKPFELSGRMLWGFDDAAKAAVYEKNLRQYKDPGVAAYHTLKQLVDYSHQSQAVRGMRYVAPFATWRARMPEAVLRSLVENPQNALAMNRLSGGMASGGTLPAGNGKEYAYSTPLSEALQLDPMADKKGPLKYLRGSLGPSADYLIQKLANASRGPHPSDRGSFWTDYANPEQFLLSRAPVIGQAEALAGHGIFKESPRDELLYQLFGLQTRTP